MQEHSDDLLSIADSATFAERSKPTLRRWIAKGFLTATKGEAPARGGSAPTLIRRGDLVGYLIESGQSPKGWSNTSAPATLEHDAILPPATVEQTTEQLELQALRKELSNIKLERLESRLSIAQSEIVGLKSEISRLDEQVLDLRSARDDLREVGRAQLAELLKLRAWSNRTWLDVALGRGGTPTQLLEGPLEAK